MDELVRKITEYQIFNFLLPGVIFAAAVTKTTSLDLISSTLIISFFEYYFIGMVISRIGSLIVEPFLKFVKILKFAPYKDYIDATKTDPKLDVLSQENNLYRTLIASIVIFLPVYMVDHSARLKNLIDENVAILLFTFALLVIFSLAYRKQTNYITQRIKHR